MKVEAIQSNDRRQSCLTPMAKGALSGALVGYAAKYAIPVQSGEKLTPEYQRVVSEIEHQKSVYNINTEAYLAAMKQSETRSIAQDQFIKIFDGLKEGERVKYTSVRNAFKKIADLDNCQINEFRKICKNSIAVAEKTAKQCISAYNLVTKHIRPTGFFAGAGAVVGAFVALANDILKTEENS